MKILTIDTALQGCGVGLYDSELGEIIAERQEPMTRGQAEHLIPIMQGVTQGQYEGIDLIAVINGPGAFAGLRIGLMCAKTLAMVRDIPAIGISTFQAARRASQQNADVVILETKRADYYVQIGMEAPQCLSAAQIMAHLGGGPATIIGNANERFCNEVQNTENLTFETLNLIPPRCVAQCAQDLFKKTENLPALEAVYLRGPEIGTPKNKPRKIRQDGT